MSVEELALFHEELRGAYTSKWFLLGNTLYI